MLVPILVRAEYVKKLQQYGSHHMLTHAMSEHPLFSRPVHICEALLLQQVMRRGCAACIMLIAAKTRWLRGICTWA